MNSELASLVVIVMIAIGAFAAYRIHTASQKRKTEALTSPKRMEDWIADQGFAPDHFSFFHGTGIALKDGDDRIVLYRDGAASFYPIADLISINAYESIDRGVPRGAAPGVVELNVVQRYNIDITIRGVIKPCALLLPNKDQSKLWEGRLNALIKAA